MNREDLQHRILIATDGSPAAKAALATASNFPWRASAHARAVVAQFDWLRPESEEARAALTLTCTTVADGARRELSARWPEAEAIVIEKPPADAILEEAQRFDATLVVLGWRGHGAFRRLLAGSVSRTVAAHAECPVLVVREAPSALRRFVVGFDGCENAGRALEFLCSLEPASESEAVLVNVLERAIVPGASLLPASARRQFHREAAALNEERSRRAQEILNAGVARLARCGWSAKGEVRIGAPLERLLRAADDHRADILVLGARAVSGLERALLGSVANGALNRSRIPILLVR